MAEFSLIPQLKPNVAALRMSVCFGGGGGVNFSYKSFFFFGGSCLRQKTKA